MEIKCLSIKFPFSDLIRRGKKTIELRTWQTAYRGPILIVSTLRPDWEWAGHAVIVAELVDIRPAIQSDAKKAGVTTIKNIRNQYSWILRNIRPIKPFRQKGRLGLFSVNIPRKYFKEISQETLQLFKT